MPHINEKGEKIDPAKPNAIKLETFIFDAIPCAADPLILQTVRAEEFSPVKNAVGNDSPDTARRDMIHRAARWLSQAGFDVPLTAEGTPDGIFEISPLRALDAAHLRETLTTPPVFTRGGEQVWA